ncbi:MAG: DUF4190 domain-containing protein [Nanoarchaeota archaeon]|nr:DUF4190 domain-containing protein [Nanoarchaeota archaeon]
MANQQLIDYIKENLSGNISIEHIKKSLLDAGWPEQEVEEAIRAVKDHPEDNKMPLPREKSSDTSILPILSLIFAFLFPIVGLILGIIALSKIKKDPSLKGRGLAIAGVIISSLFMIIPLLIVILFVAFFGTYFHPSEILPEKCTLPMGLDCNEFSIISGNPGSISLTLENGMGSGIMIRSINITRDINSNYDCYIDLKTDSPGGPKQYKDLDGWHLAHGEKGTVKLICPVEPIEPSDIKTKGNIIIVYCADTMVDNSECHHFSHTMEGTLVANIK